MKELNVYETQLVSGGKLVQNMLCNEMVFGVMLGALGQYLVGPIVGWSAGAAFMLGMLIPNVDDYLNIKHKF